MTMLRIRASGAVFAAAAAALWLTPAYPHAVCGDRIFPATLAIDDPGVTDELTVPTVQWLPQNSDGAENRRERQLDEDDLSQSRPLGGRRPDLAACPGGFGWDALDTELKYQFMCIPSSSSWPRRAST